VAVNLALTMMQESLPGVLYADCDVEAPNGHLFLQPVITRVTPVGIPSPVVDVERCTGCGRCAAVCRYGALACVRGRVLVFRELCHGCGGCTLACPAQAITEEESPIGVVEQGEARGVGFIQGRLDVGVAMSPPLIRGVKRQLPPEGIILIDAPPGAACPVMAAVKDSDYIVLVTEPTPFGAHDLTLAVDAIAPLGIPLGVVVNRCGLGDGRMRDYCRQRMIPVLAEIPDDRRVAEAYSRGEMAVDAVADFKGIFSALAARLLEAGRR